MYSKFVVITYQREGWNIKIIDQEREENYQGNSLISLYDMVNENLRISASKKEKIVWLYHFYNQSFIRFIKDETTNFKDKILLKFNYNIEKLTIVKKVIKVKNNVICTFWCFNKQLYKELKEFLKLFNRKLNIEDTLCKYFDDNYEKKENILKIIYLSNFLVLQEFDENGLKRIITVDENSPMLLSEILDIYSQQNKILHKLSPQKLDDVIIKKLTKVMNA